MARAGRIQGELLERIFASYGLGIGTHMTAKATEA